MPVRRGGLPLSHTTPAPDSGGAGKTSPQWWHGDSHGEGRSASAELEQAAVGTGLCSRAFSSKASWGL